MNDDEEEFSLEDLEKLGPIFRWTFTILGLVVVGLITFAGYKGWIWYIVIPVGSALFFGCRVMKRIFDNQIHEEKLKAKKSQQAISSAQDKVSFEEFMEMLMVGVFWYGVGRIIAL